MLGWKPSLQSTHATANCCCHLASRVQRTLFRLLLNYFSCHSLAAETRSDMIRLHLSAGVNQSVSVSMTRRCVEWFSVCSPGHRHLVRPVPATMDVQPYTLTQSVRSFLATLKVVYTAPWCVPFHGKRIAELRSITCHTGSHSTCTQWCRSISPNRISPNRSPMQTPTEIELGLGLGIGLGKHAPAKPQPDRLVLAFLP